MSISGLSSIYTPQAFATIAAHAPQLLIVDVAMGERESWEVLDDLLAAAAAATGTPVLLISTSPRLLEQGHTCAARYGHDRYLSLPFGLPELLTVVEEMLAR